MFLRLQPLHPCIPALAPILASLAPLGASLRSLRLFHFRLDAALLRVRVCRL